MRSAALVLIAYALMLALAVVWPALPIPILGDTPPDVVAVTAGYLGLTARQGAAGAVGAAVVTGYLGDLLSGAPRGLLAMVAGLVCLAALGLQRRILVRGWVLTAGFAFTAAFLAAFASIVVRALMGGALAGLRTEVWALIRLAVTSGLVGVAVVRLYRRVDAAFARTNRERDHALEGLAP
ncbi:MAG: hypothetical protein R3B06_32310 [Kofleriaceae bacterium]